jgi:hypothetical protein
LPTRAQPPHPRINSCHEAMHRAVIETNPLHSASNLKTMRKTAWIWFVGCAAWFVDGVAQLRLNALAHAQLAFLIAMVFLIAGLFYRSQKT